MEGCQGGRVLGRASDAGRPWQEAACAGVLGMGDPRVSRNMKG